MDSSTLKLLFGFAPLMANYLTAKAFSSHITDIKLLNKEERVEMKRECETNENAAFSCNNGIKQLFEGDTPPYEVETARFDQTGDGTTIPHHIPAGLRRCGTHRNKCDNMCNPLLKPLQDVAQSIEPALKVHWILI
ncbi:hypothetical protein BCR34DRAFT_617098 [Clohesyomyces aquaticus]|uniref:Uncharacterized protein n=1 Tax=Clohesyomyces aquaticus TaxID=1231657 RepID=A0A1Y1Z6B4_9PLEO|nr:hypothetical protein BCR34DRAFT_617098 [Clohesyomyces aquaticus]